MLRKLLKHEFIATSRIMFPCIALLMLFSVAVRFFDSTFDGSEPIVISVLTVIVMTVYIILIFVTLAYGFFNAVIRFHKNIFTDEGYLMNTIPVKPWNHIATKLIAGTVWIMIAVLAMILSVTIVSSGFDAFAELVDIAKEMFSDITKLFKYSPFLGVQVFAFLIFGVVSSFLQFFAADAVGSAFTKKKGIAIVTTYIIVNVIEMIAIALVSEAIGNSATETIAVNSSTAVDDIMNYNAHYVNMILGAFNGILITVTVGLFALTNFFMSKKLNLE